MRKASSYRNEVRRDITLEQENARRDIADGFPSLPFRNHVLPIVGRQTPQIEDVCCCVPNLLRDNPRDIPRANIRLIPELGKRMVLI